VRFRPLHCSDKNFLLGRYFFSLIPRAAGNNLIAKIFSERGNSMPEATLHVGNEEEDISVVETIYLFSAECQRLERSIEESLRVNDLERVETFRGELRESRRKEQEACEEHWRQQDQMQRYFDTHPEKLQDLMAANKYRDSGAFI
jgi:hypothetical protein